ncbi:SLC13 family permease [Fulvivirga lutea]|uniref:DASS family sodium-coupled anion symporter n=1 Tax=Fulvivirga lutea TaxID=2810512 RepID=A0A974WKM7_9BACT|nr:DASS family sodium-coupled anion symporter [Fulvivirga lutea]QSE98942.1 DASS family sodium-coupled anion symporter [Fulvivirga lutea]
MNRKSIGLVLGPLLFAITTLVGKVYLGETTLVIATAFWMITWWVTEAVSIPVTALLPLILFPLSGVLSISEAAAPYSSPIIFLFMGGFMIALGLEKHNLHMRLALNILKITGSSGNGVILGFMISTAILSMWISNTATAVMMLPIAASVVQLLSKDGFVQSERTFALALMLSIAYSANIGGTMTLIGTPPNVVMAGYLNQILNFTIGFSEWLMLAVPIGLLLIFITYLLLTNVLFRNNIKNVEGSEALIDDELKKLGAISLEEKLVIFIFGLTAFGWIFKGQINALLGAPLLTDHITAMIGGCLMFSTPLDLKNTKKLIDWEDTKRLPWGILLLFGGGMSLANALAHVGLIDRIGELVSSYSNVELIVLMVLVTGLVLFMTEFMSNVALVTILIPVIIAVSEGISIDPLFLVVPATLASSCAFMMPISTPPNAIVYSSGHIKMSEMIKAGFFLNLLSVVILTLMCYWVIPLLF